MATACSEELNSPFRLRIDCPAGPLVCPGEAQPRKGCSTEPENQTGCEAGGTHRRSSPRSRAPRGCVSNLREAEAPHRRPRTALPPRPARQVPAGARPGLGPNFGERPSSPAAPAAPRFSRSLSPSRRGKGPTPPQRASGRCAREAAAARRRRPLLLFPPPRRASGRRRGARHLAPLGAAAARGSPSPCSLPLLRAAPRRWAWLGLRLQRGARRESPSPRRGEPSAQAHGGGGGGGRRRAGGGDRHRLPARPLTHAAEPQSAGAPLPPQPPPMTSSPAGSR